VSCRNIYGIAKQVAEKLGFVSGYRSSDIVSSSKSDAPFGGWASNIDFFRKL